MECCSGEKPQRRSCGWQMAQMQRMWNKTSVRYRSKKPDVNTSRWELMNLENLEKVLKHVNKSVLFFFFQLSHFWSACKGIRPDVGNNQITPSYQIFMARCQIGMKMAKPSDGTVTFAHRNVNKALQSKANSFGLWMYKMKDHNNKNNVDFWQRSKAACLF